MSIFTSRPALRWGVPVAVFVATIAGGAPAFAASAPSTPPPSAAQILTDVQNARNQPMSGTVVERADLGLPAMPSASSGSTDLKSLLYGSHTLRVWYAGPTRHRVALLGTLGETDIIRNGRDMWVWDSQKNTAVHSVIGGKPQASSAPAPTPTMGTSEQPAPGGTATMQRAVDAKTPSPSKSMHKTESPSAAAYAKTPSPGKSMHKTTSPSPAAYAKTPSPSGSMSTSAAAYAKTPSPSKSMHKTTSPSPAAYAKTPSPSGSMSTSAAAYAKSPSPSKSTHKSASPSHHGTMSPSKVALIQTPAPTGTETLSPTEMPTATETMPASPGETGTPTASPTTMTPQEISNRILTKLRPYTTITTRSGVKVAGRTTNELILVPRDAKTLIGRVTMAVDARQHVPLRVQIFAKNYTNPAFETAFTQVNYAQPNPAQFNFTPPPGATVKEAQHRQPSRPMEVPTIVGKGWSSVAIAKAPPPSAQSPSPSPKGGLQIQNLPPVRGAWGSGHLLTSRLGTMLFTDDGRVLAGAVPPQLLYQAAAK